MNRMFKTAMLTAGCAIMAAGAAMASEGTINIAYTAIPDALIQTKHVPEIPAGIVYSQTTETLIAKNKDGELEGRLAETWEVSDDAKEYTFHLRDTLKWSDGEPVTADDVVYTFNMLKEAAGFGVVGSVVDTTEKIDDYTVKITLNKPNVVFLSNIAIPMYAAIQPAHGVEKFGDDYGTSVETTLSCGAYTLTEWVPDVSITMVANPEYYRGEPAIETIVYHEMLDTNATVVALQTGELDLSYSAISGTAYTTLAADPNITIEEFSSGRNESIYMYCKDGIFSDVRMRQAVAYAINAEEALMVAADGLGTVVRYPGDIGELMSGNPTDYEVNIDYTQDIEKAKALVAECGMEGAEVVVKSYNTEPYATIGVWLQAVLQNIGLNATCQPEERSQFLDELMKEELTIFPLAWVGQAYDMDEVLGGLVYSANAGSPNNEYYINEDMDALVDASRAETDAEARKEIFKQIIDKYLEDMPFVPLYNVTTAFPHTSKIVTDYPKTYQIFDYKWAE
ncbi:MAG: ABC transporter substrate-binding protein [Lachnospiraceae bacterium]|nr:ABC transporter substrate-binding protein [Lachnospiraceae bacterium]